MHRVHAAFIGRRATNLSSAIARTFAPCVWIVFGEDFSKKGGNTYLLKP